jgi:hypothetical protein
VVAAGIAEREIGATFPVGGVEAGHAARSLDRTAAERENP